MIKMKIAKTINTKTKTDIKTNKSDSFYISTTYQNCKSTQILHSIMIEMKIATTRLSGCSVISDDGRIAKLVVLVLELAVLQYWCSVAMTCWSNALQFAFVFAFAFVFVIVFVLVS